MKIALASDHGGYEAKKVIREMLEQQGYEIDDFGCDSTSSCDYPDFGIPAAKSVVDGKNDRAVLICTNGIGMCMLANKITGVRGALVYNENTAALTRKHHDSNVLCLGGGEFDADELKKFAQIWLTTEFEGGRHKRRMDKIRNLEPS